MNVPTLRFPEFSGEWSQLQLGKIGPVLMCKRVFKDETTTVGEVPFFKIGTFGKEPDAFISRNKFEEFKSKYSFPRVGEILISAAGTIGRTEIYDGADAYFQDSNIVWIANDESRVINSYLSICYNKIQWTTENTTIARLYNANLKSMKVLVPPLPEQKKIAAFLGVVDAKIAALRARRDGLERYKRGLMQALFSQTLRFTKDDGTAFPDWEEKRLGEVAKIYDGTHQTPNYVDAGIPFFSVEQVTANNFDRTKFITEDVFEKESKRVVLERGDILMTRIGDIGTCRLIDWDVRASFYVSLALVKCNSAVNSSFLNQFMSSILFQRELWKRTI